VRRREALPAAASLLGLAASACSADPSGMAHPLKPIDAQRWRITFGSCADQKRPQPIWQAIAAERPMLHLFGGDNVYASEQPWSLANLQAAYALAAQIPGMTQLMHSVPYMAMWDDHDYGFNDGGAEFAGKQDAKKALLDFFKYPTNHPLRSRDGLYDARIVQAGALRVQIILLDTRWFRSPLKRPLVPGLLGQERYRPDDSPDKTMLGAAQWAWLEAQLRQSADLRLIYSGIQVLAEGHGWERWGNLPRERSRLFELISQTRAQGVVFLSGDRHIGAIYRQQQGAPYPLWEVTSSGLTHAWSSAYEAGPNREGELVRVNHYGLIELDPLQQTVSLQLKDTQGASLRQINLALKDLQP
jgi:alkaline phosphatase D